MDRRSFFKTTGCCLGGILVSQSIVSSVVHSLRLNDKKEDTYEFTFPDYVKIECEGGLQYVITGNNGQYIINTIRLNLKHDEGKLSFFLSSPNKSIKSVTACWSVPRQHNSSFLGDHWERGYGDLQWRPIDETRIMPWYFMEYDGHVCNGIGVMTGCHAFCSWRVSQVEMQLVMDVRNGTHGVILGERILEIAHVVSYKGNEGESPFISTRNFCSKMCTSPRLPKDPVYGINDWYFAYGNNSDSLILQTVDMMTDLVSDVSNRPFCLIDAGWACIAPGKNGAGCWSDNFYTAGPHFKDMGQLAFQIKKRGMRPGLWMRPLCAPYGAKENLLLPLFNRSDSPHDRILDPTIEENKAYLRKCFKVYHEWGYEMVKHDFTTVDILGKWGFEMMLERDITRGDWSFHDRTLTTAEVILALYKEIRNAAGDIYIIGCNTISHLAAGLFELQRTGDDTSGKEWGRTLKMGANTLAFRSPQHNIFYSVDADCVGLTTDVNWKLNKQWMELLAASGTPLFISAQPEALGNEQRNCIKRCFEMAAKKLPVGEPLDWMESLTPSRWLLNGEKREFFWNI